MSSPFTLESHNFSCLLFCLCSVMLARLQLGGGDGMELRPHNAYKTVRPYVAAP